MFTTGNRVVVTDEEGIRRYGQVLYYYKEKYVVFVPMNIVDLDGNQLGGLTAVCTEDALELYCG